MANTCGYFYTPAVSKKKGVRVTLAQRFRRWKYERENPMPRAATNWFPVYPEGYRGKKL